VGKNNSYFTKMSYEYKDKKIVCIVSDNLEMWQTMNIVGHLAIGLGASKDGDLMGRDYLIDGSGVHHRGIARYGFIIKKGNPSNIRDVLVAARENKNITFLDFPREMLDTSHDDELSAWVLNKKEQDFEYLGIVLYGPTSDVNALTKPFSLWN
jgi:hypothetical protein